MRYFFIILILASCSSASKLRRAEKLIDKAEELGAKWRVDTVKVQIPYSVPEVYVKEVHHALPGDTVRIEKERLKIKYVRLPGDSIFIEGKCEGDTIYKEVAVTVTKTIEAKNGLSWCWLLLALAAGGLLVRIFTR